MRPLTRQAKKERGYVSWLAGSVGPIENVIVFGDGPHAALYPHFPLQRLLLTEGCYYKGCERQLRAERAVLGGFPRTSPLTSSNVRRIVMRAASRSMSPHF